MTAALTCEAILFAREAPVTWLATLDRLLRLPEITRVVFGTNRAEEAAQVLPADDRLVVKQALTFNGLLLGSATSSPNPLLVMMSPVLLPHDGIVPSLSLLEGDARIAAVCFLSNAAGHLSFPYRNAETPYSVEGYDETSLTRTLRRLEPHSGPVPVSATAGAVVLLNRDAVMVTGGPATEFDAEPELAITEMVLRANRRGMRAVLDASTYVTRPWELAPWGPSFLNDEATRHTLHVKHPFFPAVFDVDRHHGASPLSLALNSARAKAQGLRVLVDASCLGPIENGTQVQTLALVGALARRDDVQWVGVGVPGTTPAYAVDVLSHPKVKVHLSPDLEFADAAPADVIHRPFQTDRDLPWERWRQLSQRVVVTVQDLISFETGAYHFSGAAWLEYRRAMVEAVRRADSTVVISHDVAATIHDQRMPVDASRVLVIENGTDHLAGNEPESIPAALLTSEWTARRFLVVLGADYSHKNRDLAIAVWRRLRDQGHSISLVLAGVTVAQGSSRVAEAQAGFLESDIVTLADVSSHERNWLLRHAELCLYPTMAEGFGLVPFEAARFGTATLHVRFGPLAETLPDVPVSASSWDVDELASQAALLLGDEQVRQQQIKAVLENGTHYTWDRTAEKLVAAYRNLLANTAL